LATYSRSIAIGIQKEHEIARMYFIEQMKPRHIAKKVGLSADRVSRIVDHMKRRAKSIGKSIE
jgi:DNA-binding transcriptional regulator LsrR (DeoR family)